MINPKAVSYSFSPAQRTIDFAGTQGFDLRNLKGVIHPSGILMYFPGDPDFGADLSRTSGTVVALLNPQVAGLGATDPLICIYEDGTAPLPPDAATAARQDAQTSLLTTQNAALTSLSAALSSAHGRPFTSSVAPKQVVTGAGRLSAYDLFNADSLARVVSLYDSAAAPASNATPILVVVLGGSSGRALALPSAITFTNGLWVSVAARGSAPAAVAGDVAGTIIA